MVRVRDPRLGARRGVDPVLRVDQLDPACRIQGRPLPRATRACRCLLYEQHHRPRWAVLAAAPVQPIPLSERHRLPREGPAISVVSSLGILHVLERRDRGLLLGLLSHGLRPRLVTEAEEGEGHPERGGGHPPRRGGARGCPGPKGPRQKR
eukprot:9143611-Pyramimonas_sp.AAC.1